MSSKKSALGKGLSALLSDDETDITSRSIGKPKSSEEEVSKTVGNIAEIEISQIETNPFQPRTVFEKEALIELADSIKEHGIIQPITVRKLGYGKYQLISGERRFRASQLAGLKKIPAYIRRANDQSMLEMALVENIQRRDLDSIEVAISYKRLMEECSLTQEELGGRVGKNRSTVTNYLRLLKLAPEVQTSIRHREISMGHARALVSIEDESIQVRFLKEILENDLSVRAVEALIKDSKPSSNPKSKAKPAKAVSFQMKKVSEDLKEMFQAKVKLKQDNKGGGKIEIPFASDEDLQRIIAILDL
jgi:ParB family chromosome partitioning protein